MEMEQVQEISIKQLSLSDWGKYKAIRLEALQNDPQAFGGSYEKESQRTDKEWQDRMGGVSAENAKGILVAAEDAHGELVGTIGSMEKEPGIWRINAVYVKPSYRGQRISKKLLNHILSIMESRNSIKELELTVNIRQEAAVKLYQSCGFTILDIEKDHVMGDGKAYDSYLMKKLITK